MGVGQRRTTPPSHRMAGCGADHTQTAVEAPHLREAAGGTKVPRERRQMEQNSTAKRRITGKKHLIAKETHCSCAGVPAHLDNAPNHDNDHGLVKIHKNHDRPSEIVEPGKEVTTVGITKSKDCTRVTSETMIVI